MKKLFALLCMLLLLMNVSAQSTSKKIEMDRYNGQWEKVRDLENQNLPKSVLDEVNQIYKFAVSENNTPQIIKSLIYIDKYKSKIDNDEQTSIFTDLEGLVDNTTDVADKAILHALLAKLYSVYYESACWNINGMTDIVGYVPKDMKEWTSNIFKDKIIYHLKASLENPKELQSKSILYYEDILDLGEDSRKVYPSLYDYLLKSAISQSERLSSINGNQNVSFYKSLSDKHINKSDLFLPTQEFIKIDFGDDDNLLTLNLFSKALRYFTETNNVPAIIFTEINRNYYLANNLNGYSKDDQYKFLLDLEKRSQRSDYNVEVINAIVNYLQQYPTTDNKDQNIKLKEAYDWCNMGIEKYPDYAMIGVLKLKLYDLQDPYARITAEEVYYPENKDNKLIIKYRNLNEVTISFRDKKTKKIVKKETVKLNPEFPYSNETLSVDLGYDQIGNYELLVDFEPKTKTSGNINIAISRMANFVRNITSGKDQYQFYVVDRQTGKPIDSAIIEILKTDQNSKKQIKVDSVVTNQIGIATYDLSKVFNRNKENVYDFRYKIKKGNDAQDILDYFRDSFYFVSNEDNSSKNSTVISIFTDRNIYRPGQTVFYKAVSYKSTSDGVFSLNKNVTYNVELYNANGQKIAEKKQTTNDFGSVAGEFVLPQNGLTGQFYIKVENYYSYFNVEEYKRPTFEITFDKIDQAYTFSDIAKVSGLAQNFSGIKLQDVQVKYTVTQYPFMRWGWWLGNKNVEVIEEGFISTKDDGTFEIDFAIPQKDDLSRYGSICDYQVNVSVTDQNGETQSASTSVIVGNVSIVLSIDMNDQIDKDSKDKLLVKAENLNGKELSVTGDYIIYSLLPNDSIKQEITKGKFTSANTDLMPIFKNLPSAKYQIQLFAKDDKGRLVETKQNVVLYSYNDDVLPIHSNEWILRKNTKFGIDKPAEFLLGISAKDATVLYEIFGENNKLINRELIQFDNSIKHFSVPYKAEYGKGVLVLFTYMIDSKAYSHQIYLTKEELSKDLNLKFDVFRDKLKPGQHEEWRISVKNQNQKPVFSEVLASMYDISLDKLYPTTKWSLSTVQYPAFSGLIPFYAGLGLNSSETDFSLKDGKRPTYGMLRFDDFNLFGISFYRNSSFRIRGFGVSTTAPAPPILSEESESTSVSSVGAGTDVIMGKVSGILSNQQSASGNESESFDARLNNSSDDQMNVGLRRNFNETAFFYPQLRTNKDGETIISFVVPESNTTWKFRALAYDQELNNGYIEALAVSRKELMVTPNIPRFVRQGDNVSISTKVSNLSEGSISGNVKIVLFDPTNDKEEGIIIKNQSQPFTLLKDESKSVTWSFIIPENSAELLGCKIIADSESFSDGEQHVIPVLPNSILVTESMSMNIIGTQTKDFKFYNLINNRSKTINNYRLTLEYSNNPTWYAVQALPVLSNPTNKNAINWFASYYVNTLGRSIVQQYPKIVNVINNWKSKGIDDNTLKSNLLKNEELKSILLEETPWVFEAQSETEQMNRLSLLFDLNNTSNLQASAIEELRALQRNDGAWAWYQGMSSNRNITQYILYGFAQLINLNVVEYSDDIKEMQMKALMYIDEAIVADFEHLKTEDKNWKKSSYISTNQLEYLYVRSFYRDIPISQKAREAERFYTSIAEKNWQNLNLYEQSLLAVLSIKNGNKSINQAIMKSIRQFAIVDDEKGMFWANSQDFVFVGQSAVCVHVFLMDAFKESGATIDEMDKMKQWLLKQKQTQLWESTHATIDAIYALLSNGTDWLSSSNNYNIKIGYSNIDNSDNSDGLGYLKQSWNSSEISSNMGNVSITKSSKGLAWGSMYWQYYENVDSISAQQGNLQVDKKLFKEQISLGGKSLVEVGSDNTLQVGDRVVIRLVIRTDRDMQFVYLKDMRASCFEPINVISGLKWKNNAYYYEAIQDASTNFFFDYLVKGTYIIEYPVVVNRVGEYSNGISTIQCLYAPEFVSHTKGFNVLVK